MSWSDALGIIGSLAGTAGSILGGSTGSVLGIPLEAIGKVAAGVGGIASTVGQGIATNTSSQQSQHAAAQTGQALDTSLILAQAQEKREQDAFNKAMGLVPQEMDAYNKALAALGPAPTAPTLDMNTVAARAAGLLPEYMTDADQKMQAMFSNDMGTLMSAGIDDSTFGVASRAALGAKSAQVHREAYNQAYGDALNYATSIYNAQDKTHQQLMSDRAAALKEAIDPYTAQIGDYSALYGKTGGSSAELTAAGSLGESLAKMAGTGAQSAALGASASDLKNTFKDMLSGLEDIWGNKTPPSNTTPLPIYGSDVTGGSMGGHI